MRLDIPLALLEHFRQDSTTLALCWAIERKDGLFIRGTEHDADIQLPATIGLGSPSVSTGDVGGLYRTNASITASDITRSSDMSVDNTEAQGTIQQTPATVITDLTVRDIEGGLLDNAPVFVLACNWRDPAMGYVILTTGHLGKISRDSDGRYQTEVRGLTQLLSQAILQTYGERCSVVRLGDHRCKLDIQTLTTTVTVASVEDNRRFHVTGITEDPGYYMGGILRGLTGENAGIEREVKRDARNDEPGFLDMWIEWPFDVEIGDTFDLEAGCDRLIDTCRDKFNNVVNIRAYGVLIPGVLELLKGPV